MVMFFLFYRFNESSGLLQGKFHFLDGNYLRIIINCIYFLKVAKAFFDSLHSRQPFQGCFSDVVSLNIKDRLGFCAIL